MSEKLKRIASFIEALPVEASAVDCESVLLSGGGVASMDATNEGNCTNSTRDCYNSTNTGTCRNVEGNCGGDTYNGKSCVSLKPINSCNNTCGQG